MQRGLVLLFAAFVPVAALPGPVSAARILPADTAFTASGPIRFTKGLVGANCSIALSGRVAADGSRASVDSVTFSGNSFKCAWVIPTHLPWSLIPTGKATGSVSGIRVTVRAPLIGGECGPSTAAGSWDDEQSSLHAQNVVLDGGCVIDDIRVRLTPALRIQP